MDYGSSEGLSLLRLDKTHCLFLFAYSFSFSERLLRGRPAAVSMNTVRGAYMIRRGGPQPAAMGASLGADAAAK